MQSVFLFYTQAELGAPGYLSRTGEQGAETLAETVFSFLTEGFGINIEQNFEKRSTSLSQDEIWKSFKDSNSFAHALSASSDFYQDVLIVAGSHSRTLKTSEYIAKILALPVSVDDRLDKYINPNYQSGTLIDGLNNLVKVLPSVKSPKVILVATSLMSIVEWVKSLKLKNYSNDFEKILMHSSENDTIPSVLIAGFTNEAGKEEWLIDLPELS
ncbi:MAG: hypothetical protein DCC88_11440 [Spirobacillus cienkowskii]|jgi:hypothetical protein|uniref:Uncharacterized protein n=1 Tax=Spirobacillus cienkowskii TaxID=495820 RepID=A0A369KP89_9BACT|nr:MAG: hypothetical protein DCC88_11440 [Spirobacillus cienkowskii]